MKPTLTKSAHICLGVFFATLNTITLAAGHGPVTAIAASTDLEMAFIGYSSGAVARCTNRSACYFYKGTPTSAVITMDAMDVSSQPNRSGAWVGYQNGEVYFCILDTCRLVSALQPAAPKTPILK
jgi:hypothetical protein